MQSKPDASNEPVSEPVDGDLKSWSLSSPSVGGLLSTELAGLPADARRDELPDDELESELSQQVTSDKAQCDLTTDIGKNMPMPIISDAAHAYNDYVDERAQTNIIWQRNLGLHAASCIVETGVIANREEASVQQMQATAVARLQGAHTQVPKNRKILRQP
ncbi:4-hydroxy-2-oxovalerate aldolase, putative [Babesia ovata]|uniref:4-hydroxy-2-oxovalerate aldolase, putative n=1 Tax=Babesia ovata TaxID=189622 RepID=A0A2H6KHX7_9APIC|nr:4-hydroxy-2-oxovalerate aldolase, putative [Babesia ovata]GBE62594.1 4-hydroxy-2-oxovalerate aldolase, putative [Babesia ovata]